MKFSERWLREWVDPPVDTSRLVSQLTEAGLEVDSVEPAGGDLEQVVVAEVVACRPHPEADRLVLCEVRAGGDERFSVVCGAPNVREGGRYPLALVGARLPDGTRIRKSRIRGVVSEGMLCSARELGLGDDHEGILELPPDAPTGVALAEYLELDDRIIEIDLTPNRGDCLSIAGVAREVAAINAMAVREPEASFVKARSAERLPIELEAPRDCPRYVGRIIRDIDPGARTPVWMSERLRRSGVRSLGPVVDVTNYVMLELGQPMHAFDLDRLEGGIRVRRARAGESLELLDGRTVTLESDTLVIADHRRAVALAGIMGGASTAVGPGTRNLFLESAFFSPLALAGRARRMGLHTDASHRFERGVDPELQRRAMERATELLLDIVGGEPGPVVDEISAASMPRREPVTLRADRITRLLGMEVEPGRVVEVLERLGMSVESRPDGWRVRPPSYRFDIEREADLVEEVARLVGYARVPARSLPSAPAGSGVAGREGHVPESRMRQVLVERGYHEAITYSFVDPRLQALLDPEESPIALANPISSEMAVMRTRVWIGLVGAALHNVNRQQPRVRLFETGLRFRRNPALADGDDPDQVRDVEQPRCVGGIALGPVWPEQWGAPARMVDFFDVKSDLEALVALTRRADEYRFVPAAHPALHPGQQAEIRMGERVVGHVGVLDPGVVRELKLPGAPVVFELELEPLSSARIPAYRPFSPYPSVRRDISIVLERSVTYEAVRQCVGQVGGDVLKNIVVFDQYLGEGIDSGKKSLALGLVFQASDRTLRDEEVEAATQRIVSALAETFGARLRG